METNSKLSGFISGLLTGTVNIGPGMLSLIGAYRSAQKDPEWKEKGISEWLTTDPKAGEMLERVLAGVKDTLPESTRAALILALGGIPTEEP